MKDNNVKLNTSNNGNKRWSWWRRLGVVAMIMTVSAVVSVTWFGHAVKQAFARATGNVPSEEPRGPTNCYTDYWYPWLETVGKE
jgi:hypothetical protein